MTRVLPVLLLALACRPPAAPEPTERRLTILAMNDWHASFGEHDHKGTAVGGLPWFAAAVDARRSTDPDLLLFDAGDGFQGDPSANATLGHATVDAFNLLGVDAAAIGNHEFDHGPCTPEVCTDPHPLRGALRSAASRSLYPYLSANITTESGEAWAPPGVHPHVIIERNGLKVGVLGLTTTDTPTTTKRVHVADLRFTDVVAAAERSAKELRADGADLVVALAHVTGDCRDAAPDGPCQPDGELGRLLTDLPRGTLDLVVAGHAHHAMQGRIGDTTFIETGSHGAALGEVSVVVDTNGTVQARLQPRPLWSTDHTPADPWCQPDAPYPAHPRPVGGVLLEPSARGIALARDLEVWNGAGCTEVGCLAEPAGRIAFDDGGSPLGALVADALLAARPDALIAVQNAGGLRADFPAGVIRQRDVDRVMPFRDHTHTISISGAHLLRALEVGASGAHGPLLPAGLTYTVTVHEGIPRDLDGDGVPSLWERDRVCAVTVGDAPLDLDATYTVVVSDFLHGGGDHQTTGLAQGTVQSSGPRVADAIGAWIAEPGPQCRSVPTDARMVVTDCDPRQ